MSAKVVFDTRPAIFVENTIWRGQTVEETTLLNEIAIIELEDKIFSQEPDIDLALARLMAKTLDGKAESLVPPPIPDEDYPPESDF